MPQAASCPSAPACIEITVLPAGLGGLACKVLKAAGARGRALCDFVDTCHRTDIQLDGSRASAMSSRVCPPTSAQ